MKCNTLISGIKQIKNEISNSELKENKKEKYIGSLEIIQARYENIEVPENLKDEYNALYNKGNELLKEIRNNKNTKNKKIGDNIEAYIRYLKAAIHDFEGKSNYLRKYISAFVVASMLFLALTPQYYGYILPILFFVPIYLGLKGVKNRSITGFYMSMSVVPVALMTAFMWINNGINVLKDYNGALRAVTDDGVSVGIAKVLVYGAPLLGVVLLVFALAQLYRGYKCRDLFV
jgi:hypothetical protein